MKGTDVYRLGTRLLSAAMAVVGVVLIVESLTLGGVRLARLLLGVLFVAAGSGRLYLQVRRGRDA
jgi:hypothetical protein